MKDLLSAMRFSFLLLLASCLFSAPVLLIAYAVHNFWYALAMMLVYLFVMVAGGIYIGMRKT